MRNRGKKTGKKLVSMLLLFALLLTPLVKAEAAESASDDTKVDFVLVLDCSGSMDSSDQQGLSISAAKMFADMIPMENARIGVVGFGGDWGKQAYVYNKDKKATTFTTVAFPLSDIEDSKNKNQVKAAIDDAATKRNDKNANTNMGYALQAASEMLRGGNSEAGEACIVLMSDGRMTANKDADSAEEAAKENVDLYWMDEKHSVRTSVSLEAALEDLAANEWPVYCLELAFDLKEGKTNFTVPTGQYQMQHIADATGGQKVTAESNTEVEKAFSDIFAKFYDVDIKRQEGVIEDGKASLEFEVEEMIAEMNITVTGSEMDAITAIELTDAQGNSKKYEKSAETDSRMVIFDDKNYAMIKLMQPMAGNWAITAYGSDGIKINLMAIPMLEVNFSLNTSADLSQVIPKGGSVDFTACFVYNDKSLSSERFYHDNPAYLEIIETGEKTDMTGSSDNYSGSITFKQSGTYTVRAVVESGRFRNDRKESGEFTVTVENLPSEVTGTMEDLDMGFNAQQDIDCTKYFSNPDNDPLKYKIEVDQTSGITGTVEKDILTLKTGVKAGDYTIRVLANDGAMEKDIEQSFTVHLVNQPLKEKGSGKITKTISYNVKGVPGFIKKLFRMDVEEVETIDANEYFEDPDGVPPVFEVKDLPEDSAVLVENGEPGILNVSGKSKGEVTFKLVAKDASDESISFEKEVTVKSVSAGSYIWGNIWGIVLIIVIVLVIIIILLVAAFAGRKIYGVWNATVGVREEGPLAVGKMGHGKKSTCTLKDFLADMGFPEDAIMNTQVVLKAGNNFTKTVVITGLQHAESVAINGASVKNSKVAIKKKQHIDIEIDGQQITLERLR